MRIGVNNYAGCYGHIEELRKGRWETMEGKTPLEPPICNLVSFLPFLTERSKPLQGP